MLGLIRDVIAGRNWNIPSLGYMYKLFEHVTSKQVTSNTVGLATIANSIRYSEERFYVKSAKVFNIDNKINVIIL